MSSVSIRSFLQANPEQEAVDILAEILKINKGQVFIVTKNLTTAQLKRAEQLIKQLRLGKPLAYIFGYKYFYGLRFLVTKDTLVPRPESELLVDRALEIIKNNQNKIRTVLDVGTGSGCIAIAVSKNCSNKSIRITATDVSSKALLVARKNAKANGTRVRFSKSDLLASVTTSADLLIANLPYGWGGWTNNSSIQTKALKFEPRLALFTTKKGLGLIEKLLFQIQKLKDKPKFILLEFDPRQKNALEKMIKHILPGYKAVFKKDLRKLWRYVEISK